MPSYLIPKPKNRGDSKFSMVVSVDQNFLKYDVITVIWKPIFKNDVIFSMKSKAVLILYLSLFLT